MRGRTGLYKAGLGGWTTSVCLGSDWVTPFQISPRCVRGCIRPPLLCQLMWFGDGSSKVAVSTLLCGGVAVCHGRTGARLFAGARGMSIPQAGHWLRGKLIIRRREVRGRTGFSQGEPYPGREVRGRTGLYKAGLGGWATSVCLGSDWVTPFRISPRRVWGCLRQPLLCQLMWFGDSSSTPAVSTLLCGGVAICHGRTGARLFADARGMDIPRAGHWLRGKLILRRARGTRQNRVFPGRAVPWVHGRTGLYKPVLVAGPPVYAWVVTGSLLFGSPPDVYGAAYDRLCCVNCCSTYWQYSGVLVL